MKNEHFSKVNEDLREASKQSTNKHISTNIYYRKSK